MQLSSMLLAVHSRVSFRWSVAPFLLDRSEITVTRHESNLTTLCFSKFILCKSKSMLWAALFHSNFWNVLILFCWNISVNSSFLFHFLYRYPLIWTNNNCKETSGQKIIRLHNPTWKAAHHCNKQQQTTTTYRVTSQHTDWHFDQPGLHINGWQADQVRYRQRRGLVLIYWPFIFHVLFFVSFSVVATFIQFACQIDQWGDRWANWSDLCVSHWPGQDSLAKPAKWISSLHQHVRHFCVWLLRMNSNSPLPGCTGFYTQHVVFVFQVRLPY